MTTKELLIQEIETLPPELLTEALNFIREIKTSHTAKQSSTNNLRGSTGSSLLEHLKTIDTPSDSSQLPYRPASGRSILRHAGTWSGDDFQECLQSVYATRGKAKFDYDLNPFE